MISYVYGQLSISRACKVRLALEVMFEGTKGDIDLGSVKPAKPQAPDISESLRMGDAVTVSYKAQQGADPAQVVLEWEGSSTSDMLADAIIAIVLQVSLLMLIHLAVSVDHSML